MQNKSGTHSEAQNIFHAEWDRLTPPMLAAIQASIIMMSQNRQSARDRIDAEVDHEVNVRAELAIHDVAERIHAIEFALIQLQNGGDKITAV